MINMEAEAPMIDDEKYSCMLEIGAEILMFITSYTVVLIFIIFGNLSDQDTSLFLSAAYALFLPLMSYQFSQATQYNLEGRPEVFLIWMVFMEIIRIRGDLIFIWDLRKSVEQFVRIFWVGFLVNSYAPLHGFRASLFVLCIYFAAYVLLKAIVIYKAKESHLIGKNPKLIHRYMKRVVIQDDLKTTPMTSCDYIVMGENYNEMAICSDGYLVVEKKSNSEGMLKIGRVFQINSPENDVFTVRPHWRDTCLSFALAKMLRRRFAKLRLDEEGCRKALDFVLDGLIDYIGRIRDIRTAGDDGERNPVERVFNGDDGERNPVERVFSIINEELKFVCDFWHMKVPTYYYFGWCRILNWIGIIMVLCNGLYLIFTIVFGDRRYGYIVDTGCFLRPFRSGPVVAGFLHSLEKFISGFLFLACLFVSITGWVDEITSKRWSNITQVKEFIKDPTNSKRSISSSPKSQVFCLFSCIENCAIKVLSPLKSLVKGFKKNKSLVKVYSSVLDLDSDMARLKWIRGKIARSSSTIGFSTNAKEAILVSLRFSGGLLTNGEKSLEKYGMEHLNWACQPNGSTTKGILVWHIATTLFHHQENSHQEPPPQQNQNFFKEQEVALSLSSYCHYLVKSLPGLLPDEVEWSEELYETVKKEILDISLFSNCKPTKKDRCNFVLNKIGVESSMVGMGVILAKELMNCAENGTQVWKMLADFWAEMILFIAPSDNVDGHEKILNRQELITQLWTLLTHAGILTRPKPTERPDHV